MNETIVTAPSELEIRVERTFDAPPRHESPHFHLPTSKLVCWQTAAFPALNLSKPD